MGEFFNRVARVSAEVLGTWQLFIIAVAGTAAWLVTGPIFGYSDTWQLVVNTVTTVLTFLAVFLIQNAQNRDAKALQIKLDELLVKLDKPDSSIAGIEQRTEEELREAEEVLRRAAEDAASDASDRSLRSRTALGAEVTSIDSTPPPRHRTGPPAAAPSASPGRARRWSRMIG